MRQSSENHACQRALPGGFLVSEAWREEFRGPFFWTAGCGLAAEAVCSISVDADSASNVSVTLAASDGTDDNGVPPCDAAAEAVPAAMGAKPRGVGLRGDAAESAELLSEAIPTAKQLLELRRWECAHELVRTECVEPFPKWF